MNDAVLVPLIMLAGAVVGVALGTLIAQIVWNVEWLRRRIIYGDWRGRRDSWPR